MIHEQFEAAMQHKEEKVRIAAMTFAESYGCAMGSNIDDGVKEDSSRMVCMCYAIKVIGRLTIVILGKVSSMVDWNAQ